MPDSSPAARTPPVRRVAFHYPDDFDPAWHPTLPEFACAANAVSLMMPYAEPYVAKSVRSTLDRVDPALREQTASFVAQEMGHHRQHRRFNDLLVAREPGLARLERWMQRTFGWLHSTRSDQFNVAFAAGFETIAYTVARWTEQRAGQLLRDADDVASTLFLWHLAEEVEHKRAAWDAYHDVHGSRRTYAAAMSVSFLVLAFFTVVNTTFLLWKQRRLFRPVTHWRMLCWSLSFLFEALPQMVVSTLSSHHPTNLVDPTFYELWLREFDADTQTMPIWHGTAVPDRSAVPDRTAEPSAA